MGLQNSQVLLSSANEFANAFRTRPVEALQMLLKGLDEAKENGGMSMKY